MYRADTEIKLLKLRQKYYDALGYFCSLTVVPLTFYKTSLLNFMVCDELLKEYRNFYEITKKTN